MFGARKHIRARAHARTHTHTHARMHAHTPTRTDTVTRTALDSQHARRNPPPRHPAQGGCVCGPFFLPRQRTCLCNKAALPSCPSWRAGRSGAGSSSPRASPSWGRVFCGRQRVQGFISCGLGHKKRVHKIPSTASGLHVTSVGLVVPPLALGVAGLDCFDVRILKSLGDGGAKGKSRLDVECFLPTWGGFCGE